MNHNHQNRKTKTKTRNTTHCIPHTHPLPPPTHPLTHCRPILWNPSTGRPSHHRIHTLEPTTTDSPITSQPTHHWICPSQPTTIDLSITISTHPLPNRVSNHCKQIIIIKKKKKTTTQQQRSALGWGVGAARLRGREKSNESEKKKKWLKWVGEVWCLRLWGRMRKKRKEESDERGERKENKKILNTYSISVRTLSYLKAYCSLMPNILTFTTLMRVVFWCLVC